MDSSNGTPEKKLNPLTPEEDIESVEKSPTHFTKKDRDDNMRKFAQENFHERDDTTGEHCPTKSFGKINFKGSSHTYFKPRYLRLSDEDSPDDVLKLMTQHWQLAEPKLVVAIVGGANRFDNGQFSKNRIQTLFKQGLPEIAMATGAWIITPGSKSGIYQMVGSAVKDYSDSTGSTVMNNIVLLGISSWGAVSEREKLKSENGEGLFPASYPTSNIFGKKRTHQPIDPNHSHFILVDDGSRDKFGGEEKWRAKFERKLAKWSMTTGTRSGHSGDPLHIPFVVLLVNGGDGSLQTCAEKLEDKVPLLAIAGSGRAAEVVISIKKFVRKRGDIPNHDQFLRLYVDAMGYAPSGSEVYDWMKTIADYSKYVSVFDFIQPGINTDDIGLDRALLSAIYHPDEMTVEKRKAEMRLAIAWKNVDYARYEIFNIRNTDYTKFIEDREFFSELAMQVLLDDMPELMALFMDHGLDLAEFVTDDRLCNLYERAMMRGDAFSRFMKNKYEAARPRRAMCIPCGDRKVSSERSDCLLTVGDIIKDLLGYSFPNVYKHDASVKLDPAQQIFLWAALFNRMDYAKMFWRLSKDHISGAIVGAAVLRGLAKRSNHQEGVDITVQYSTSSLAFEALANGILECCWSKDRQYTSDMLVREAPSWGHTTILSMAYHAEMEEFLAQPACYTKLTKLWRGDIALRTHPGLIILFAVCPLFIFALKFVRKKDSDIRMDEHRLDPIVILESPIEDPAQSQLSEYKQIISVSMCGDGAYDISLPRALYRAISSPIVKCIHYSILFLAFLMVYSLFLMHELRPYNNDNNTNSTSISTADNNQSSPCQTCCLDVLFGVGCLEIATYACVFSYLLEEIRQVIFRDTRSMLFFKEKFSDWISDFWNQVDVLSYVIFIVAVVLRFYLTPQYFEWSRWMFCITLVILFIRFSQVFFIAEQLGPKVIMIRKMMYDLGFFVVILFMVIIVFGVLLQSIANPEEELSWAMFQSIFYYPYFMMYGELFLDSGLFKTDYHWVLLAFYMIITNVLLLNLLIAMFSYTFDKVQEKSEILWKFNYYAVVYEHYDRPYFPLIGTIIDIVRAMRCSVRCMSDDDANDFRRKLNQDKNDKITKFVKLCMEKFMAQENKRQQEDMAHKVTDTSHRLGTVIEQLDDLRDDVMRTDNVSLQFDQQSLESRSKAQSDVTQQLAKKMDTLERNLNDRLNKIMELVTQNG